MLGLLAVWRALGLDVILREAWESGVILAGLSAGAMCWFEWGVTKSLGYPAPSPGLGFLPGTMSVHMDGEPNRLPICRASIADGTIPPGYAADDGVALLFTRHRALRRRQLAPEPPRAAPRPGRRGGARTAPARDRRPLRPTPEIAEYRRVRALTAPKAPTAHQLRARRPSRRRP